MRNSLWAVPVIFLIGVGLATQNVVNTALARYGGPLAAIFISVAVTMALLIIAYALGIGGIRNGVASAIHAPPYLFIGGICGFFIVLGAVVLIPRVGAANYIALFVAGQLIGALVLDHFGVLGLPKLPITAVRIIGALLLVGGTRLIIWR